MPNEQPPAPVPIKPMFVDRLGSDIAQAAVNKITIMFYDMKDGKIQNGGNPLDVITAIVTNEFQMSIAATWQDSQYGLDAASGFTAQMDGLAKPEVSGNQEEAFKAGPHSSLKYKGIEHPKFSFEFTSYADVGMSGIKVSSPLKCFYMLMLTQLPKGGRGNLEQQFEAMKGQVGSIVDAGKNIWNGIKAGFSKFMDSDGGILDKANAGISGFATTTDDGNAATNMNPGNWIISIMLPDILSGWFVLDNVTAIFSRDRYYTGEPLFIKFKIDVQSYLIPDKEGLVGGMEDIVKPITDRNLNDIYEFAKLNVPSRNV